jgi:hypothetical protein
MARAVLVDRPGYFATNIACQDESWHGRMVAHASACCVGTRADGRRFQNHWDSLPVFVRAWTAALVLMAAPLAGLVSAAQPTDCAPKHAGVIPATAEPEIRDLQEHLKAGPFYRELVSQLGRSLSCSIEFDAGKIGLTYAFRNHRQLIARIDPKIEFSEQRLEIRHMEMKKAIALLKEAEADAYRPNGCGIAWDHPAEESADGPGGSREAVYRGSTCNCQARVTYQNSFAVSLVLRSAC